MRCAFSRSVPSEPIINLCATGKYADQGDADILGAINYLFPEKAPGPDPLPAETFRNPRCLLTPRGGSFLPGSFPSVSARL